MIKGAMVFENMNLIFAKIIYLLCRKTYLKMKINKQKENFMTRENHETVLWVFFLCTYLFYKK